MKNIDVMLSKPGIYMVIGHYVVALVEVDAQGKAFQLEVASGAYRRDGELKPGGWLLDAIAAIHGPFSRSASVIGQPA